MKAFLLIWALMSSGPQGEVAQSVHLTRAECQASLGKIATNVIIDRKVDNYVPAMGGTGATPAEARTVGLFADIDAECVQFRVER